MSEVLIPIVMFLIPISAIVGSYFIKYKKLELEQLQATQGLASQGSEGLPTAVRQELMQLLQERQQMNERIGALETEVRELRSQMLVEGGYLGQEGEAGGRLHGTGSQPLRG